jgi:hypothetical protein
MPDIGWNIDPQDWKTDDEEAVFSYLTSKVDKLKGRGIMLLHDTHEASVHALPKFLDWLARENKRAVGQRRPPVNVIDYAVMVLKRPVTASDSELVGALVADARGSVARHLPDREPREGERGRLPHPGRHRAGGSGRLRQAAVHLDSVNLPDDRALAQIIERPQRSFAVEAGTRQRAGREGSLFRVRGGRARQRPGRRHVDDLSPARQPEGAARLLRGARR